MNHETGPFVIALDDGAATLDVVGGKGASLARLATAGLPVPRGFHVTTAAYRHFVAENGLQAQILAAVAATSSTTLEDASREIADLFAWHPMPQAVATEICEVYARLGAGSGAVAVRSSATAEDLPGMSFAGQQETFLNMRGEAAVLDAVKRCWASLWTARAIDYRTRNGIDHADVALAVVVQELVQAEAAGVMFTADPVSGSRDLVLINAGWGLGEAVVGGQVTPDTIVIDKAGGAVVSQQINAKAVMTVRDAVGTHEEAVPADRQMRLVLQAEQAAELARLGLRIEELYGQPMDVEWALCDRRFFVVQARPITGLRAAHGPTEEWNDSLRGDFLWTSGNVGEAVPDVMTPCTWSLVQIFMGYVTSALFITEYPAIGNIGGRFYMNLSLTGSIAAAFGLNRKRFVETSEQVFGRIPGDLEIPKVPLSRWRLLRKLLPIAFGLRRRVRENGRKLPIFLATAQARCDELRQRIEAASSRQELIDLWHTGLHPFFRESSFMLEAAARRDGSAIVLVRRELQKLVSEADANNLLSGLNSGGSQLASLGLLLGLTQLARGDIDRATFARTYGHRSSHEFEVSIPRPVEDPAWIDRQLAGLRDLPVEADTLLERQRVAQQAAWRRFVEQYPSKAARMRRRIEQATTGFRDREAARSEVIRVFWALRAFVQRAGNLTGQGVALFFLSIDEILAVLGGDEAALKHVPVRRATYERYAKLPPYPTLIRGHFEPFAWAADPNRRSDIFDASRASVPASATISGFPGAVGVVEGQARVIATVEEGEQLRQGEVLVTTITNIGWTPLFPRAAAIVTDVGAPLSHAAIVARELGIPAVVGCGNATMRLHTGDWVRVNGGEGTVEVLQAGANVNP